MSRCLLLCSAAVVASIATPGCGGSAPTRAPIKGQVAVGGQPLASGRILFTPLSPTQGPAVATLVKDGRYELPQEEGPVVGKNKVEVEAALGIALDDEAAVAKLKGRIPPNPIPPDFNLRSQLVAEVQAGQQNTYDVTIPNLGRAAVPRRN